MSLFCYLILSAAMLNGVDRKVDENQEEGGICIRTHNPELRIYNYNSMLKVSSMNYNVPKLQDLKYVFPRNGLYFMGELVCYILTCVKMTRKVSVFKKLLDDKNMS